MKCVLVQENWVNYSDAVYDRVGNIQMSRILGADVRLVADGFDIGFRKSWEDALESVRAAGGKPYAIPAGCSDHPLGGLGFVGFAEEVRQQEAELGFKFDYIVVCSVTGSTQAGMVVGFAADGRAERVIGIDASAKPAQTREQIIRIAKQTAEKVELGRDITSKDVVLDERFGGPEYGLPNDGTLEAIRLCARLEGMLTDPVYEGKSMHGMIDMVRNGEFPEGSRVLYAHLGGVPALNGYSFIFRNGGAASSAMSDATAAGMHRAGCRREAARCCHGDVANHAANCFFKCLRKNSTKARIVRELCRCCG
jgi:1-aminocyclopropane-1-carboxylate deaminase